MIFNDISDKLYNFLIQQLAQSIAGLFLTCMGLAMMTPVWVVFWIVYFWR